MNSIDKFKRIEPLLTMGKSSNQTKGRSHFAGEFQWQSIWALFRSFETARCTTAVCKISISVHSHGDESDVVIRIKIIAGHLDFNRFQSGRPITPEPGSSTIIDHYKGRRPLQTRQDMESCGHSQRCLKSCDDFPT